MGCAEILPRSKHLEGFREAEIGVWISNYYAESGAMVPHTGAYFDSLAALTGGPSSFGGRFDII